MKFEIRQAYLDDAKSIHNLIEKSYRGESAKSGWTFESDLIDGPRLQNGEIEHCIQDKNQKFLVAIDNYGVLIGVICVTKNDDWVEFGKFSVEPKLQGHGIGKQLILAVSDFAKNAWGATSLKLMVISSRTELVDFYKRQGFVETGQTMPFIDIHPYVILKNPNAHLEIMVMERPI